MMPQFTLWTLIAYKLYVDPEDALLLIIASCVLSLASQPFPLTVKGLAGETTVSLLRYSNGCSDSLTYSCVIVTPDRLGHPLISGIRTRQSLQRPSKKSASIQTPRLNVQLPRPYVLGRS